LEPVTGSKELVGHGRGEGLMEVPQLKEVARAHTPEPPEETVGGVAGQIQAMCRELASLLEGHCRTVREKDNKIREDGDKVPPLCCSACKQADGSRGICGVPVISCTASRRAQLGDGVPCLQADGRVGEARLALNRNPQTQNHEP
jgi:hypothetical protein